jgi:hypothetical protein
VEHTMCRYAGHLCSTRIDVVAYPRRKPNYPGRASHVRSLKKMNASSSLMRLYSPISELRKSPFSLMPPSSERNHHSLLTSALQNAGFLIPNTFRGLKIGKTLGKSYLIYGPKLGLSSPLHERDCGGLTVAVYVGYRGSVFNLVFKSKLVDLSYLLL